MERRVFLILLFSGLCSLSSCLARQYVFVNKPLTWTDAQRYCREKHTDLASIDNAEELDRLLNTADSTYTGRAWIGLYYLKNRWQWSLRDSNFYRVGQSEYHNWSSKEPDNSGGSENCVDMYTDGSWFDVSCTLPRPFICYQETSKDTQRYVLIDKTMNWTEAQRFCREKHTDLVSVRNQSENEEVKKAANGQTVWIGLFSDPWKWSDQRNFSFRNWYTTEPNNYAGNENCGTVCLQILVPGTWGDNPCTDSHPFFCYHENREVMKLHFLGKRGVNPNTPAVRETLLEQIKSEWLKLGLPEDTTLRWREQPDRQVFHQEEGGETLEPQC
ncbi:C-type mannose receptor 2-like [Amia ocellicauda]|uniref:C-type mannose receptor 2-like n=1 Tax=Amia ocellicauda TaxID=2972642 RepID=UPI003464B4A6